jgi:hypothetical protein
VEADRLFDQRSGRSPRRPRSRAGWAGVILLLGAAGCSSGHPGSPATPPPHKSNAPTTAVRATTTTTSGTTTSSAPPVQASSIQLQITGSTVVVQFASSDLSGSLATADPGFSAGGTVFSFLVQGVTYGGSPVTATSTSAAGLIDQVVALANPGGVSVRVTLRSEATSYQLGLGHNLVGLTLSAA